jgi:predicted AlkP superfamily phosphohydrolase/phosphomutase/Tfp pilus assembly protein PilF
LIKRPRRAWLIVLLLAMSALILLSTLVVVPAGSRAVLRGGLGMGEAKTLDPGWHFRLPLVHSVHRYPSGSIRIDGTEEVTSLEGVSLKLPYRFEAGIDAKRLIQFDDKARGRGSREFLQEQIRRLLFAWFSEESASRWTTGTGRPAPPQVVGELEALGLVNVSLSLGKIEAPRELARASVLAELKKKVTPSGRKILLVGLDGADWQLIDPWIRQGKLPVLARLKSRSAWANLKSLQPILSPLLWTTVATGRTPEEHGVVDFLVKDPATGQKVPISSRFRKVPALWNIFTEMGKSVDVVAWWASWPAEPVNGVIVSDRVSYSLFGYQADAKSLPSATYPSDYLASLRGRLVTDGDVTLEEVRRFADLSALEFQERRAQIESTEARKAYADPVNHLTRILASTRNYQTAALDLLSRGQPDLTMVYFQGIDEICHRFAHLMPPKMAMVSAQDYRRFNGVVEAFYRYQDKLLGELLAAADPSSLVFVLSDHGFKNGAGRPTDDPPYIEGKPGKWHRLYGIFMMAGPGVKPGQIDTVSLLDVAPTVLAAAGLPVSEEMPGRVLSESFQPDAAKALNGAKITSYDFLGVPQGAATPESSAADAEMIANLRSLGYIGGAAEEGPGKGAAAGESGELTGDTVTYHSNLAALHLKSKSYAKAQEEVDAALKLVPDYVPALMTQASLYQSTQKPDKAIEVYRRILESGKGEGGVVSPLADLYVKTGRIDEGIAYLEGARKQRPQDWEATAGLGKLWDAKKDLPRAEALYREALRINPVATEPAAKLFEILKGRGEETTLEPLVVRALQINENSVGHHNLMGLLLESKRDVAGAERHLRRAAELDPDFAGVLANLGSLLARTGRTAEAIQILTRAVAKEPANYEARMNLGAALGKSGRHQEAIEQFEEARRRGFRSATLFNGLAIAYHETGQMQKCLESLKESLALDPNQPQVKSMLAEVQGQRS